MLAAFGIEGTIALRETRLSCAADHLFGTHIAFCLLCAGMVHMVDVTRQFVSYSSWRPSMPPAASDQLRRRSSPLWLNR